VAGLGLGVFAGPALAKKRNCNRLCKTEVKDCKTNLATLYNCTALSGKDRRTCKHNLKVAGKGCKTAITGPTSACASSTATTCSPSGAFLD